MWIISSSKNIGLSNAQKYVKKNTYYDAFDEDNKSAEYSNDLDQEEDELLARSNQEDLSNLDMTMTGKESEHIIHSRQI